MNPNAIDARVPPFGASQSASPGSGRLNQTLSDELTADASTTAIAPAYVGLLSVPIVTIGGDLYIDFSMSGESDTGVTTVFAIFLDGVIAGLNNTSTFLFATGTFISSCARVALLTGVAAGAHTVEIRWAKTSNAGAAPVASILAATASDEQHASVVVQEVLN